jgi:hypothetical protein
MGVVSEFRFLLQNSLRLWSRNFALLVGEVNLSSRQNLNMKCLIKTCPFLLAGLFMKNQCLAFLSGMPAALIPVLLMLVFAGEVTVSAQVVTNSADSGPGTLRSTITNGANDAVITFDPSLAGASITLASTLTINTNLTIDASTLPGGLQISGNDSSQIFKVASNITVFLNSLSITNGFWLLGGGIENYGILTLTNCNLSGNSVHDDGGGIYKDHNGVLNDFR